jgi:hypothetical protein
MNINPRESHVKAKNARRVPIYIEKAGESATEFFETATIPEDRHTIPVMSAIIPTIK